MAPKSSLYRGVTLFKPTQRWRAQISSGGKTLSLGDHESEEDAARAFDRASINKLGPGAKINFPLEEYAEELEELLNMPQNQLVGILRERARKSSSAAGSKFRGVANLGCVWQATINLDGRTLLLGKFDSELKAAEAYDHACILKHLGFGGALQLNLNLTQHADFLRDASSTDIPAFFAALPVLQGGSPLAAPREAPLVPGIEAPITPALNEEEGAASDFSHSDRSEQGHLPFSAMDHGPLSVALPSALSPPVGPSLQAAMLMLNGLPPHLPLVGTPSALSSAALLPHLSAHLAALPASASASLGLLGRSASPREAEESRKRPGDSRDWKTGANRRVKCRPSRCSPEEF